MSIELYRDEHHACLMFSDLMEEDGQAVQSNQFLIVDHGVGAVIDPGGNLAFNELYLSLSRFFPPQGLKYIVASHADPDIIASLDRWMTSTRAKLVTSCGCCPRTSCTRKATSISGTRSAASSSPATWASRS